MPHPLDPIVQRALTALAADFMAKWDGRREREIVSLFCFGPLLKQCSSGSFLYDPTQIGIEVPVPKIKEQTKLTGNQTAKNQICKDIVIWPKPGLTCWDLTGKPTVAPASIIEWKHNEKDASVRDVKWLTAFSVDRPDFVGYAVCTHDSSFTDYRLTCCRIANSNIEHRWLLIK
jgi:hypothetical protein